MSNGMITSLRVAQISDCHLFADPLEQLQNSSPDANLTAVLEMIV